MHNTYGGWNKDLNGDSTAASYFDSLPLEIKEKINRHADEICSVKDMMKFAEHMQSKSD